MNLTQRLSFTHGFIALLTAVVTLVLMIGGARHLFWNDIHESQQRQMDAFTLAARESYFAHEDVATLNFIRLVVKQEAVAFAAFTDPTGKSRLILPDSLQAVDLSKGDRVINGNLRVNVLSQAVDAGGTNIGTVTIGYDTDKLEEKVKSQVDKWMGLGAAAGLCALLVALFMSILLSNNLVKPLKRIRIGTEQVRAGKLDRLVDVDRSDEIGSLARDFNSMVVQLKELESMKRDFVAGVTHDFGTPLHAIKNALEFLQEKKAGPLTEKQAEYLLMISNNTLHLTTFINSLLTVARIEAAKAEPYFEPIDVLALAREVVELYHAQADKLGIELRLLNEEPSLSLITDVTMFRQVLTNLISNAMKFTLKGSVSVVFSKEDGFFTLKVIDTGIGIAAEHHALIFDKFSRIRQPKNFPAREGSGLGLAIAKGLVEAMGGFLTVESQPGTGSTFTVKIPKNSANMGETNA